jgi:phosphohistidine phosphatase SixA
MMRHADSEEGRGIRDHDRSITPTGATAARDVAAQLVRLGWIPDVLIASNAARSRQTLDELRREIAALEDADVHFLGSLYTVSQLDGQCQGHVAAVVAAEASSSHECVLCLG